MEISGIGWCHNPHVPLCSCEEANTTAVKQYQVDNEIGTQSFG